MIPKNDEPKITFHPLGPFVVIGATGFLGAEITNQLCNYKVTWLETLDDEDRPVDTRPQAPKVVVLARSSALNPALQGLPITVRVAPVVTKEVLESVMREECGGRIGGIFHVGGLVKHTKNEADCRAMREANVELSNTIFEFACINCIRVVYASSSGVVGCQLPADKLQIAHDDAPIASAAISGLPYYMQKAEVERIWREKASRGQAPIVFLRPSLLLGPGDERLSSTRVVLQLMRGELPFMVSGGVSWVDVRDAAAAFIEAMMRTKTVVHGTVMNLTAENTSFGEFAKLIKEHTGCSLPAMTLPGSLSVAGARALTSMNSLLRMPRDEGVDPVFAECGVRYWNVSCQRAADLLDFEPRDAKDTIIDTTHYLRRIFPPDPVAEQRALRIKVGVLVVLVFIMLLIMAS